jgi:hypothetical protein
VHDEPRVTINNGIGLYLAPSVIPMVTGSEIDKLLISIPFIKAQTVDVPHMLMLVCD